MTELFQMYQIHVFMLPWSVQSAERHRGLQLRWPEWQVANVRTAGQSSSFKWKRMPAWSNHRSLSHERFCKPSELEEVFQGTRKAMMKRARELKEAKP